jgi:hypothetical protein
MPGFSTWRKGSRHFPWRIANSAVLRGENS